MKGLCFICDQPATHWLGIRCRYSEGAANGNADWAPNLDAVLCDEHAISGCDVEITYTATRTGVVHVHTTRGDGRVVSIKDHPIGRNPNQGTLL